MSQESRNEERRKNEINLPANSGNGNEKYEGFEGMNYEQIRQPYNLKNKARNNSTDQRKESNSPESS